ncbi:MAG: flippase-like domain-containing protein [Solirubrobacteraceae bacterium]|nr:flippase-like domain-containing protein [Solirubrobacteraceae bacterium]
MQSSGPTLGSADLDDDLDDDGPGFDLGRRQIVTGVAAVVVIVAVLYVGLPLLPGIEESFGRITTGEPLWLAASFGFTVLSFAGYVLMFRGVYRTGGNTRIDLAVSYQITMAGLAATRILAAGGAGGLVLTAWALRQSGMDRREVADRTVTFLVLMYVPYMLAIIVGGLGMRWGLFPGPQTWGITVLPALLGGAVITIAIVAAMVPSDLERRIQHWGESGGRRGKVAQRLANLPASTSTGVRGAWAHVRRGDLVTFGAFLYWGAQVAALWAAFQAFGASPPLAVVTLGFFIGMLGNLLPLPGGVGGVDGGMIGALAALGHGGGVAVAAVLTYRVFAFWLPTIPGFIAFLQLRHTVAGWKEERRAARSAATTTPAPAAP